MITSKQLEKELERIYAEMRSWPEINRKLNYVIPKDEVSRRESILRLPQILYRIQDARKEGSKNEEYFNLAVYYLTKMAV